MAGRFLKCALVVAGLLVAGLTTAPGAGAAPGGLVPFEATSTLLSSTVTSSASAGGVTVLTVTNVLQVTGDLTGTEVEQGRFVIRPDGSVVFSSDATCTCTYQGSAGTARLRGAGTGAGGAFGGPFVLVGQPGPLRGLVVVGALQGFGPGATLSGTAVSRP
jgi:hypothetical protein